MSGRKLLVTPLVVAVHRKGENASFGATATHIVIEDEGGGGFVTLKQFDDDAKPGEIRLEKDEMRTIAQQAQKLLAAYEKAHT